MTDLQDIEVPGRHQMYRLTVTYTSGYSDVARYEVVLVHRAAAGCQLFFHR